MERLRPSSAFFNTIGHLRTQERVILYDKMLPINPAAEQEVLDFLAAAYYEEALDYPFTAPPFSGKAALWAAKHVYWACQLILHRQQEQKELVDFFPPFEETLSASTILSADLCLRFLAHVIKHAKVLQADDPLILLLEKTLQAWHYSAIGYPINREEIYWEPILQNPCLKQLYINRIIHKKAILLAQEPIIHAEVNAALGMHAAVFWKELV